MSATPPAQPTNSPVQTANSAAETSNSEFGKPLIVLIVATVGALAVGVTGLATTGTLGRAQRNYPIAFTLALALAAIAACCFVMAAIVARTNGATGHRFLRPIVFWEWTAKPWRIIGVLAALGATILGYHVAVSTAGDTERPAVAVHIDSKTLALLGSANASHLSSADPLNVSVDGLVTLKGRYNATRIWDASVGPDSDGNVSVPIDVSLPPGRYDAVSVQAKVSTTAPDSCVADAVESRSSKTPTKPASATATSSDAPAPPVSVAPKAAKGGAGCQILPVPARQRPQIAASWEDAHLRLLKVVVSIANAPIGQSTDRLLHVEVVARASHGHRTTLYRSVSEPSPDGHTEHSASIRISRGVTLVCARAHLVAPGRNVRLPSCPMRARGRAATVELRRAG